MASAWRSLRAAMGSGSDWASAAGWLRPLAASGREMAAAEEERKRRRLSMVAVIVAGGLGGNRTDITDFAQRVLLRDI